MSDTIDYLNQRIKALEALTGRLTIEKDQLKETIRELCSEDELPEGYKEIILRSL
jgi:mRNA-degrading endonuclease YafQ of YafQ-DinJ toxin-antitoxin module